MNNINNHSDGCRDGDGKLIQHSYFEMDAHELKNYHTHKTRFESEDVAARGDSRPIWHSMGTLLIGDQRFCEIFNLTPSSRR